MTISIEPIEQTHLDSPALLFLLEQIPHEAVLQLEINGGMAQAVLSDGETIGILTVTPEREAMIGIHPDHQGKGAATTSLGLARDVAIQREITWVTATALIDRPSNGLLAKFGAVETGRSDHEIFYRIDFADA